jgi:hypothetical protein
MSDYLHSLIPLADFKVLLSIDDREDALSRFVLTASTYTIEQYCKRRLLKKKCVEYLAFTGDYCFPLREYPVRKIFSVEQTRLGVAEPTPIDSGLCRLVPDCGIEGDVPAYLSIGLKSVEPIFGLRRRDWAVRVCYLAGYSVGEVPADLASACMELAAWNLTRYRGRRIGMIGPVRGKGQDGEHLEVTMPENVRLLLEPYRRRTI